MAARNAFAQVKSLPNSPQISADYFTPVLYPVKPRDTLSQILTQFYGIAYGGSEYQAAIKMVKALNPSIKHPDQIHAGQLIKLNSKLTPEQTALLCSVPDDFYQEEQTPSSNITQTPTKHFLSPISSSHSGYPIDPVEQDAYSKLAWMSENYGLLSAPAAGGLNTINGLTNIQITSTIDEISRHYNNYKKGVITQNQYNYRRRLAVQDLSRRLGPFERHLFKGYTAPEALRINRFKAIPATHDIAQHSQRLSRLSRLSSKGGIILTGVGVAAGCHQIAMTDDRHKKNEIFVETLGSSIAGVASGFAIGILFAATPMGWAAILAIGTAAALGSYAAGKVAVELYDHTGTKADLVKLTNTDSICK